MRYSVLLAVYKGDEAPFLHAALKSIYDDQTRKPDEIVIVLDGPISQELKQVLQEFRVGKERAVIILPQAENRGLGEALRIGAEQCTGDYIFRMDADDISHPLRFEKQASFVEKHPEVDVLGTDIAEFVENCDEKMRIRHCPSESLEIMQMCRHRNPMNHVSVCIKRSALIEAGSYVGLPLLEDYLLWINMLGHGKVLSNLNEPLVYVRLGHDFHEKRSSRQRAEGWKQLQKTMISYGMISKMDALVNMAAINFFVRTPAWLKTFLYRTLLRGKSGGTVSW